MTARVLILDDENVRHEAYDRAYFSAEVWHAYTPAQFRRAFERPQLGLPPFDVVHFDHDIGDVGESGLDLARWMLSLPRDAWPRTCIVHSWNPAGAERLMRLLTGAGIETLRKPFARGGLP